jgi:predicted dehydrogenase
MNSQPLPSSTAPLSRFMDRRGFLRTSALTSSGLYLATSKTAVAQQAAPGRTIKCALVGCGAQGNALRVASKDVPGIQWVAMCDIWKFSIAKTRGGFVGENKHQVEGEVKNYDDIEVMLDNEPSIEAVFIATPDFLHAPYSRLCLSKGKHVYCEKMMSNTIEGARDMVRAGKEFGSQIFQIGHQRHSNPRYLNLRDNIIKPGKMLGRITHAYAQWNRGVSGSAPQGAVKGYEIEETVLKKYGYGTIERFRNWRFFKDYGGGPLSDLGAHQIDMFNWMYDSTPVSVMASGGVDYFDGTEGRPEFELPDNVMCIYEFKTPAGALRAYYQVLTTTGSQGAYEKHMGIGGTAIISELDTAGNQLYAEPGQAWDEFAGGDNPPILKAADKAKNKFWEHPRDWEKPKPPSYGAVSVADVRESKALAQWELGVKLSRKPHSPHVQNFIEAVQMNKPAHLTCNVVDAFKSCVTVLKAYESIQNGGKYIFKPEDFEA